MVIRPLEIQNAYATYDETTRIVHVTYRGSLDSEVSSAASLSALPIGFVRERSKLVRM